MKCAWVVFFLAAIVSAEVPRKAAPLLPARATKKKVQRRPASVPSGWQAGLLVSGDGLWSKVDYDPTLSKGLGWAAGAGIAFRADPQWLWDLGVQYQFFRVGRSLDASGNIVDTPADIDHLVRGVGVKLGVFYLIEGADPYVVSREPQWWLGAGAQYIHPLSVRQSSTISGDKDYENGAYVFGYLGPALDYPLDGGSSLRLGLEAITLVTPVFRTFGVRLNLAVQFSV